MKRIHLERTLPAPPEIVWELIVDPDQYRLWTDVFSPGSGFTGSWEKGGKIRFTAPDEAGVESGMLSEIADSRWPEHISIHHVGLLLNGLEDKASSFAREWVPSFENYTLSRTPEGGCRFQLAQDLPESRIAEFTARWETAFERMAQLIETSETLGKAISLEARSAASPEELWDRLVTPEKVMTWNFASEDWHCPKARNELVPGGEFHYEMAARDGSASFDFWGTYTEIQKPEQLNFTLGDGRRVWITLEGKPWGCLIRERFEAEQMNSLHLQRQGWQSILDRLAGQSALQP